LTALLKNPPSLDLWGGQSCRQPTLSRLLWFPHTSRLEAGCRLNSPPHKTCRSFMAISGPQVDGHSPEEQPDFSRSAFWRASRRAASAVMPSQTCRRRVSTRHAWGRTPQAPRTSFFITIGEQQAHADSRLCRLSTGEPASAKLPRHPARSSPSETPQTTSRHFELAAESVSSGWPAPPARLPLLRCSIPPDAAGSNRS
jgi:hypothetical protein